MISDITRSNFISLPDTGILRRISKRGLNTSLEDTSSGSSSGPSLDTLMAGTDSTVDGGKSQSQHCPHVIADVYTLLDWSFETLLNSYRVAEVTASAATGFDISGVFPDGFSW